MYNMYLKIIHNVGRRAGLWCSSSSFSELFGGGCTSCGIELGMLLKIALNWRLKTSPVRSSLKVAPRDPHFALRRFYGRSREEISHDPADSANSVSGRCPLALLPLSDWNEGFASLDLGSRLPACFSPFSSFREDQPWPFQRCQPKRIKIRDTLKSVVQSSARDLLIKS